ncbi:putative sodium/phosphate symporter [Apodospora peruviana]|uniref:Phosphate transporter n=1 Tax=Apodospora peruviana TaxID=516989 RepID=A0AAE0IVJ5_9PEZI|nr:putative sodium/phosphate symporter [Apodospora peruviana]
MVFGTIFEMLGAITCTRHSAHVSSTYSLVSAVAGVGVATVGAAGVQWGWNNGKGLEAIFAGLAMAPIISAGFGASIFLLIKLVVHIRKNPVRWAVYSSPFFFLIAGTICTLSIIYKGSPNLGMNKKPAWYVAAVTMGTGGGVAILSAIFFVPYVHAKVMRKDHSVKWWMFLYGPALFKRPVVLPADQANVPNYAVIQEDEDDEVKAIEKSQNGDELPITTAEVTEKEKKLVAAETKSLTYKELMASGEAKLHAKRCKKRGPIGWAMRTLHENPMGAGQIYEWHNTKTFAKRLPAMITGISGTPDGERMARVYAHAEKYLNEVEHTYSFVQILTAGTASFAHGANDIDNSVGPWAVIYSAWSTGDAAKSQAPVPIWQLVVLSATISSWETKSHITRRADVARWRWAPPFTVLVFSQYSLPVSTSMCITGATVGVGLCNGTLKAVNWQRVGLLALSWVATIPVAGTLGGVIMGLFLNAPHFSS